MAAMSLDPVDLQHLRQFVFVPLHEYEEALFTRKT
jgi:hypothetical protein